MASDLGDEVGGTNSDGDSQKALDVRAEEVILESLAGSGAAMLLSEEQEDPVPVNDGGSLIVAVDPLDGSSNISVNVTIGTIFSILPDGAVLQNGRAQRAAGFFTYGPQTTLVLLLLMVAAWPVSLLILPALIMMGAALWRSRPMSPSLLRQMNFRSMPPMPITGFRRCRTGWLRFCKASQAPAARITACAGWARWWLMPGVFSVVAVFSLSG